MIKVLVEDKGISSRAFTFEKESEIIDTLSDVIKKESVEKMSMVNDEIWLTINNFSIKHYITVYFLTKLELVDKMNIFSKLQEEFRCKLLEENSKSIIKK